MAPRNTLKPHDNAKYAKVKGQMKKKGKQSGGGDPKAFKLFQKKAGDLERKQRDRRATALSGLLKNSEKNLKFLVEVKGQKKMTDEMRRSLIEKIIARMMDDYKLTSGLKTVLDKKKLEQDLRKLTGTLPDDDKNAAAGHLDAVVRQYEEESEKTRQVLVEAARGLNNANKKIDAGQLADPVTIIIAVAGIMKVTLDYLKRNKK